MNELLLSFLRWIKDPFGRKEIMHRHEQLITEMQTTTAIAYQKTHVHRGGNPINRAVLGNKHRHRHIRG